MALFQYYSPVQVLCPSLLLFNILRLDDTLNASGHASEMTWEQEEINNDQMLSNFMKPCSRFVTERDQNDSITYHNRTLVLIPIDAVAMYVAFSVFWALSSLFKETAVDTDLRNEEPVSVVPVIEEIGVVEEASAVEPEIIPVQQTPVQVSDVII